MKGAGGGKVGQEEKVVMNKNKVQQENFSAYLQKHD